MLTIMKKIKSLFDRLSDWWSKERCYKSMEVAGVATFGMCSGLLGGDINSDYIQYSCLNCKHFVLTTTNLKGEKPCSEKT